LAAWTVWTCGVVHNIHKLFEGICLHTVFAKKLAYLKKVLRLYTNYKESSFEQILNDVFVLGLEGFFAAKNYVSEAFDFILIENFISDIWSNLLSFKNLIFFHRFILTTKVVFAILIINLSHIRFMCFCIGFSQNNISEVIVPTRMLIIKLFIYFEPILNLHNVCWICEIQLEILLILWLR